MSGLGKPLQLKRGRLARLQAAGLRFGEPALAVDDPTKPTLWVGDRDGVPRQVAGEGSGSGGGAAATSVDLAGASGLVDLGGFFVLTRFTSTQAGRFRLYRDAAARLADEIRPPGQDASPGAGLLLEVITVSGATDIRLSPLPVGSPGAGSCAWGWTGLGGCRLDYLSWEIA